MSIFRRGSAYFLLFLLFPLSGCMKWEYGASAEDFHNTDSGLFILCEGNFQYGNSSLSFYNPETRKIENEVFARANGMKLGDVAQSMSIYADKGWIVVNNSHVVFAINPSTYREVGRIENLTSPRYILFVDDKKAYVSQLWDNRIFIVDPADYSISGYIEVPEMSNESGSTEQMVKIGRYVYCTCWSYQNRLIKIDTETERVVASRTLGIQPKWMVEDRDGRLWIMTDGGFAGSPYGHELPALYCVIPETLEVEREFRFKEASSPSDLKINGSGDTLYWIDGDVWKMDVEAERLPAVPFIKSIQTRYFALTVDPESGEIYVADAIDYQQPGKIYRYSKDGSLVDEFYVGVNPGAFCWKEKKR